MAKNGGRKFFLIVLILVMLGALAGGIYAAWYYTDGFTKFPWQKEDPENPGKDPGTITGNYYIELDGMKYGDGGVTGLSSGTTYAVGADFGTDYTVTMTARAAAEDFGFTLGAEPYKWSNVVGDDFTAGFAITRAATGFTVEYGALDEIIAGAKGNTVTLEDGVADKVSDKFVMTVTAGNGYSITVTFYTMLESVTVDHDHIIFGGNRQEPEEPESPEVPAIRKRAVSGVVGNGSSASDRECNKSNFGLCRKQSSGRIDAGRDQYTF